MSLSTWKEEYYPVKAEEVSKEDAVYHSLRKWRGLKEENLKKHKCYYCNYRGAKSDTEVWGISDGEETLMIDSDSCALCVHYLDDEYDGECEGCPIFKLYKCRCDKGSHERWSISGIYISHKCEAGTPYSAFYELSDPEPMIKVLKEVRKNS